MPRVTIACPVDLRADANQLARCIGLGPDDDQTYGEPVWRDAAGNAYAVASVVVGEGFVVAATTDLAEPIWGCDLQRARLAQSRVRLNEIASPETISAVFDESPQAALDFLGVKQIQSELE